MYRAMVSNSLVPPRNLAKGANIRIEALTGNAAPHISITVETWTKDSQRAATDVSALILQANGKVASNDDFVFYNQPFARDSAIRLVSSPDLDVADTITLDLDALPGPVDRIVVAASIDLDSGSANTFSDVECTRMLVRLEGDSNSIILTSKLDGFTNELTVIVGEVYRHGSDWKIRSVGQGYEDELAEIITEYGIEVDTEPSTAENGSDEAITDRSNSNDIAYREPTAIQPTLGDGGITQSHQPKSVAKIPLGWNKQLAPGLPVSSQPDGWRRARMFPTTSTHSGIEQEIRATAVLLAVMSAVPGFGARITSLLGAPRGDSIETYTEVRFQHAGSTLRPDGLIRVTRGDSTWIALVEVKTGKGRLSVSQIENYLSVAKAKKYNSVVTISRDVMPVEGDLPLSVDMKLPGSLSLQHISWEEISTQAALLYAEESADRTQARILEEFLQYSADTQSGMWPFTGMGRSWVKVRDGISTKTLSSTDNATEEICFSYDQLNRHLALQLTALTGQEVVSEAPEERADATERTKQLADSGELFGSLQIPGATSPVFTNANLAMRRISCSQYVGAPPSGKALTKVKWILRELKDAPPRIRIKAYYSGGHAEPKSSLLKDLRADPYRLLPPDGEDIREFKITAATSMGQKGPINDSRFVADMVKLVNTFYIDVTQQITTPGQ